MDDSAGTRFRYALRADGPLQIVGTVNAFTAMMATQIGHQAIYLSGAACANNSYGLPDLGMTTLTDVLEDARRITAAVDTPLMVDIDTGWGGALNISRAVRQLERAGVAAIHIEDQVFEKRCGHRPNKAIVSAQEMADRIKAAVDARADQQFFILARTDAYTNEGLDQTIERSKIYLEAGADGIFAEAMESLEEYRRFRLEISAPLLANMTEFGLTPLFKKTALAECGVDMILYPLTAVRAMNQAAENAYRCLLQNGDQHQVLGNMQTREQLYSYLDYHQKEQKLDESMEQE